MNPTKAERKGKASYTEKINPIVIRNGKIV